MGYYIEVPSIAGKAKQLEQLYGAEILDSRPRWEDVPPDTAVIVVVDNGLFEAAGYAYDEAEFRAFTQPSDMRPKTFLLMPREQAELLSGRKR
jgi:hypothetical protein